MPGENKFANVSKKTSRPELKNTLWKNLFEKIPR